MKLKLIAAVSKNGIIGDRSSNSIPWMGKYPNDMKFFRKLTIEQQVVMGRKTYESIGKPLPNRSNVVITSNKIDNVYTYDSLNSYIRAFSFVLEDRSVDKYIIGGERLYRDALQREDLDEIYLTLIPEVVSVKEPVYFP